MQSNNGTKECLLLELPAAPLRNIVDYLLQNARDIAAVACCCKTTAMLCNDPLVWREVVIKRYGTSVLPGLKPSPEQNKSEVIKGYVFYQGMDGSEDSDNHRGDKTKQELAEITTAADSEAFTTQGVVIKSLKPQQHWRHISFKPNEGMYVRLSEVQYRNLNEPEAAAADEWPPVVPGWVYFPSCVSSGHFNREQDFALANYRTLPELLIACNQQAGVVAVATTGETKLKLRPQACWEVHPAYDVGLYVKAEVVQQMAIVPSPPVPDYKQLYAKLSKLRLDASRMTCAWLNDQYLGLEHMADSPSETGMALVLRAVWWLDILGTIPGVPPGRYEVVWVVDVRHTALHGEAAAFHLRTEICPINSADAADPSQPGAAAAAAAASSNGPTATEPKVMEMQWHHSDVRGLATQCAHQNRTWGVLSAGALQVTEYSTIKLQFTDTSNTLKMRMRWAFAQLLPLQPGQQCMPRNRVYVPSEGSGVVAPRRGPRSDPADNAAGLLSGQVRALFGRLFGGQLFRDDGGNDGFGGAGSGGGRSAPQS